MAGLEFVAALALLVALARQPQQPAMATPEAPGCVGTVCPV